MAQALHGFRVVDDAVPLPLTEQRGDPDRGRRIVIDRAVGNCLICHQAPEPTERFQGDLAPTLAGVGGRLSVGQLRLRVIDQTLLNPQSIMPPYYRVAGLTRVDVRHVGKPVLTAEEVEDVVAYLATLKE
jgi:sulfur-oxidizing protein SoxX